MIDFPASDDTVLTIDHLKPEYQDHAEEALGKYIKTESSENTASDRESIEDLKPAEIAQLLISKGIKEQTPSEY